MVKMADSSSGKSESYRRLNELYIAIISRYKDYIEEKEGLSVAELPTLIMPSSEKVREKAEEIKSKFLNYTYDSNFYDASLLAFGFVEEQIEDVTLPLQFWLSPDETIIFQMGDMIDKCILLCSLLIALGNPSAKVFVKIDETARANFVYYEIKGKIYALEAKNKIRQFSTRDEMLSSMEFKEDTVAYEFNNQMYADLY
jgi:hypothetical protein